MLPRPSSVNRRVGEDTDWNSFLYNTVGSASPATLCRAYVPTMSPGASGAPHASGLAAQRSAIVRAKRRKDRGTSGDSTQEEKPCSATQRHATALM